MSRAEENKEWMERQPKTFTGNHEDIDLKIKMCIYNALLDISRSLAIIADNVTPKDPTNSVIIERTCATCKYRDWDYPDNKFCANCGDDYIKWRPANG